MACNIGTLTEGIKQL